MRFLFILFTLMMAVPVHAARLDLVTSIPLVRARHIDFAGDHAWVARNIEGATLLNVSDPRSPKVVKEFTPDEMQPLYLRTLPHENLMVSADRFRGLVLYDISVPDAPTTISATPLPGMTTHLDLMETTDGLHLAVLARAGQGLLCVDITDPAAPRVTDDFLLGMDFTRAVASSDGIIYVADSLEGGLKALQVVSPGLFVPLYQANLFGSCWSLAVAGEQLLAGYNRHGFKVFDLPDMKSAADSDTTPTLGLRSSVLRNRSRVHQLWPIGDKLVVANGEFGVDLYHLGNGNTPWLADEFLFKATPGTEAHGCAVYNGLIYVSAWDAGVLVFQITDEPGPADFNLENLNYDADHNATH